MCYLLKLCLLLSVALLSEAASTSDANVWKSAKHCKLKNGLDGRCITYENCPTGREESQDPACGTGEFPDLCCQSEPEDFVEKDYGRVAKRACNKYMKNIDWQLFGFVFGGVNARAREFTFMAALGYGANVSDIKFHCGGSLISETHVLTAAHCLFSLENGPVRYVLLGDLDINSKTDDAEPQYLFVKNVTVHPQYKRSSVYHDIAILHLDRPARFSKWVQPACLDFGQQPVLNTTRFYATGWGYIDTDGGRSTHMQEVELVERDFESCHKAYPSSNRRLAMGLIETQMCAGGATERKDTCQGDSGGPLSRVNNDIRYSRYKGYIIVGITSFGKLCGFTNAPGVYTRVEKYIPWIESVVWPDEVAAFGTQVAGVQGQQGQLDNLKPVITSSTPRTMGITTPNTIIASTTTTQHEQLTSNKADVMIQPAKEVHGTGPQKAPNSFLMPVPTYTTNAVYLTTTKPVNLVDIHYFSDKR